MSKKIDYDASVSDIDDATKLRVAAWVFSKLKHVASDGGSYRYLIYNQLGFGPDALDPLLQAGAMDVTNALFVAAKANARNRK